MGGALIGVCLDEVGEDTWLAGMKRGVLSHGAAVPMQWGCGKRWGTAKGVHS